MYNQIDAIKWTDAYRTLHHILVVMYVQAKEAWRGPGIVIIHTKSEIEQIKLSL